MEDLQAALGGAVGCLHPALERITAHDDLLCGDLPDEVRDPYRPALQVDVTLLKTDASRYACKR